MILFWLNWIFWFFFLLLYNLFICLMKGIFLIIMSVGLWDGVKLEVCGDVKRNKVLFYICVWLKKIFIYVGLFFF